MDKEKPVRKGRPEKPPEERGRKIMTYLPPDVEEWLRSDSDGISGAIVRLVRAAKGGRP